MGAPRETLYRVASTPKDFQACHAVLRHNGIAEPEKLQKPAVVAERGGKVLGFASSRFVHHQLTLGRVQILPGKHAPFMAYRLFEAYENLLRLYRATSYLVGVEVDNPYLRYFERCGLTELPNAELVQEQDGIRWYRRFLGGW